jgi:hypothetical protein
VKVLKPHSTKNCISTMAQMLAMQAGIWPMDRTSGARGEIDRVRSACSTRSSENGLIATVAANKAGESPIRVFQMDIKEEQYRHCSISG